ncbi:hypothetical protein [Kitasatospora viridis]|uniref:Uncharacterized protein n=1 Tax=Kitasatospora viridis TaxID=281105 RepID=A0A561UKQ7_9ACTN|nr:hypothetical protein [Kitasatospora viridis]TWF99944.1 hypothetical protein FHX73_113804 [Kitasatospora viridis]
MGIWNSAVLLYGIPLPDDHDAAGWAGEELRDAILANHEGVSHATAGPYDQHTTYLCTDHADADMGKTKTIPAPDPAGQAERDARLHRACLELDYPDHPEPAWHLIASQS